MSYFTKIKSEKILNYRNIIEDLEYLKTLVSLERHNNSLNRYIRNISNEIDDINSYNDQSLTVWQDLLFSAFTNDRFEKYLSEISLRFGTIRSGYEKSYSCIDKLCDDILSKISDYKSNCNIIVFGGIPYTTTLGMNLICCRSTDLYRLWNWGIIAHELGHDISKSWYPRLFTRGGARRLQGSSNLSAELVERNWKKEIIADIIGTLSVGPCLFISHMLNPRLWCLLPTDDDTSMSEFFSTHPPCEVRFAIHSKILTDIGVEYPDCYDDIVNIRTSVDLTGIEGDEIAKFGDRLGDIESIMPFFDDFYTEIYEDIKGKIDFFTTEDWEKSVELGKILLEEETPSFEYSTIHVINGLTTVGTNELTPEQEKQLMNRALDFMCKV
jgi:hypothetical protein